MVSKNPYFDDAVALVERDKFYSSMLPGTEHVFFRWKGELYKGSIHRGLKERPEIAAISRSSNPYETELVETIRSIDDENERPFVDIPDDTQFTNGLTAVLHIEDKNARLLTPDDMEYFLSKIKEIKILDISLDEV